MIGKEALRYVDFTNIHGKPITTYGVSLHDWDEFNHRMNRIKEILISSVKQSDGINTSLANLYSNNQEFRHHCDRCLEMNGIDPKEVGEALLSQLLISVDGQRGALDRLNSAEALGELIRCKEEDEGEPQEAMTPDDIMASLSMVDGSLANVLALSKSEPWQTLVRIAEARARMIAKANEKAEQEAIKKAELQDRITPKPGSVWKKSSLMAMEEMRREKEAQKKTGQEEQAQGSEGKQKSSSIPQSLAVPAEMIAMMKSGGKKDG